MLRYDRQYDFGLRGFRDTAPLRLARYDRGYEHQGLPRRMRPNRVTARYNLDYVVGDRGPRHPRNYTSFGGDREGRVGDLLAYRQPYSTIGGTRTWRGSGSVRYPQGFSPVDREYGEYDRDFGLGRPVRREPGW